MNTHRPLIAFSILMLLSLIFLDAGCATSQKADPSAGRGVAFTIYDNDMPVPDAHLSLYDASGKELSQGISDVDGKIFLPRTEGGSALSLATPNHKVRHMLLPPGLAEQGGTLEYTQATPGETFILELPVTGGTGYSWQPILGSDTTLEESEMLHEWGQPGAPASQRLIMVAEHANDQILFLYTRPFEKDTPPARWWMILLEPEGEEAEGEPSH